ncbi:MAG: DUF6175 family protein [Treponemataceae bacterium]
MCLKTVAAVFGIAVALFFGSCATSPPASSAPSSQPAPTEKNPAKSDAQSRAQSLITGESSASPVSPATTAPAAGNTTASAAATSAPVSDMSDKEKQYFETYLKRLKYMMVVKEGVSLDDFQIRSVMTKGNEYLLRQGYDVINYDQLLKNMDDQKTAYEAEAGQSMSLVQYIAQKLGADVYVELNAIPRAWTDGGRHFGEANFTANMFDPSTAELLASVTFKTDRSMSNSSPQDALLNALVAGTAQFMPRVVRDSTAVLRNRYSNGIRYQLIIQKTPDSRAVAQLRRNLRSRVREIQAGPSAADQTTMDIYLFGTMGDLEDSCYAAFEKTPGLESAYWVYTRGKTITFNSGNK